MEVIFMTDVQPTQETGQNTADTWDKLMAKLDEITEKLRCVREEAEAFLKQTSSESEKGKSMPENSSQNG